MSKFIHKNPNVSVLMYHIVCPTKYRRDVFAATVDAKIREICADIQKRYEIEFLEIGSDDDHVPTAVSCRVFRCIVRNNWCK